jgi:hypothetical protein
METIRQLGNGQQVNQDAHAITVTGMVVPPKIGMQKAVQPEGRKQPEGRRHAAASFDRTNPID